MAFEGDGCSTSPGPSLSFFDPADSVIIRSPGRTKVVIIIHNFEKVDCGSKNAVAIEVATREPNKQESHLRFLPHQGLAGVLERNPSQIISYGFHIRRSCRRSYPRCSSRPTSRYGLILRHLV